LQGHLGRHVGVFLVREYDARTFYANFTKTASVMKSFGGQVVVMTMLDALRSRLAWITVVLVVGSIGMAQFLSQVALIESAEIQASLIGAMLRLAGVFVVASFIVSSMVREANDRVTELLLSQPVPRWLYLAGKFGGYAAVACLIALASALPLLLVSSPARAALWAASFACELLVVTAISLFCVLSLSQVVPAFAATAGIYVLARSISTMQAIASAPLSGPGGWVDDAVRLLVDAIALALPALDRFTLTNWLTETGPGARELGDLAVQTLVYLGLIGAAAAFDLYRKNF
jgi:ABC-type transport system involved in multi-copper enzyme maturation permease subunit